MLVQDLRPPQLAAVVAALVMPDVVSRPGLAAATQASEEALEAVFALEPLQAHLQDVQEEAGLLLPLDMDVRLAAAQSAPKLANKANKHSSMSQACVYWKRVRPCLVHECGTHYLHVPAVAAGHGRAPGRCA